MPPVLKFFCHKNMTVQTAFQAITCAVEKFLKSTIEKTGVFTLKCSNFRFLCILISSLWLFCFLQTDFNSTGTVFLFDQ